MKFTFLILLVCFFPLAGITQQLADKSFNPTIDQPAYEKGKGPVVLLDEAHYNFHTLEGRYNSFGKVLKLDGYALGSNLEQFTAETLAKTKILVIANALNPSDTTGWVVPNESAFTTTEIQQINQWVKDGGRLFLIADHMPFPGAAEDLAKSFGFEMNNGFAFREPREGSDIFSRENGMLEDNSITNGKENSQKVKKVISYEGQGFQIPDEATSILTFSEKYESVMPDTAWRFNPNTPRVSLENWSQGAYMNYGKGKIVVFGEAAMFTTQRRGDLKFGMNNEEAKENLQLLLNIIHWLDEDVE